MFTGRNSLAPGLLPKAAPVDKTGHMAHLFILRDEELVRVPREHCFQLSTALALVQESLGLRPVAGRTSGCVQAGDTVLWRGWKFGLPQFHRSLIEAFDPPAFFRDRMIAGRFRTFEHDHAFLAQPGGSVLLSDELRFSMPFGWPGALVGRLILVPHIRRLMRRRFVRIRTLAESDGWREWLPSS